MRKARARRSAVRWARYLNGYPDLTDVFVLSGTCIRRMYMVSDEAWGHLRRQRRRVKTHG